MRVQAAAQVRQQAVVGDGEVVRAHAHVDAAHQRDERDGGVVVLERAEVRRHADDDADVVAERGLQPQLVLVERRAVVAMMRADGQLARRGRSAAGR